MKMSFVPWVNDDQDEDLAWLDAKEPDSIRDSGKSWQLLDGESCAAWFPSDVVFNLSVDHGIQLSDSMPNTSQYLVVSEKLRSILSQSGETFEFFPVNIRNKKKKIIPEKYYLANLVETVSCMDKRKSDFERSEMEEERVLYFRRLVLNKNKIPEGKKIFRLEERPPLLLVDIEFARKIKRQEGCTGMRFLVLEDYGKEWR